MNNVIDVTSNKADKNLYVYMIQSLDHSNIIDILNYKILDIVNNVELAKTKYRLLLIKCKNDIRLLVGVIPNRLFILIFANNTWTDYHVFNHNYDTLKTIKNDDPYIEYRIDFNHYESITNLKSSNFKMLGKFKDIQFIELMNQTNNIDNIYDYLKINGIVK